MFSSLDLASGFLQIEMNQNDKEKTPFCVPNGLYRFKVMPMGLTNAPLTFQRMMDQILKHLNWKKCLCFFDDILIFSPTFDEHLIALDEVLSTLAQANLKVKYSKSQFALNEITFLGHRITQDGICPDPTKVSALVNIKEPTNITEVKSFIGLASYYRKYVKNFSEIALPLLNLTRKNVKFDWTIDCQNAFDKLNQLLVNPPVLTLPDFSKNFIIQSDASKKDIGPFKIIKHSDDAFNFKNKSLNDKNEQWVHNRLRKYHANNPANELTGPTLTKSYNNF
jgi:hypothetical protein